MNARELTTSLTKHIEYLASETDKAAISGAMKSYLHMCSRFHHYSLYNQLSILLSCPSATRVTGYKTWQSLGRQVRRGEHGIPICAPIYAKREKADNPPTETEDEDIRYIVVYVFDVSQTDGDDLPSVPNWISSTQIEKLDNRLVEFAAQNGISVTREELTGDMQGYSKNGKIVLALNAGTSTLIHEMAHELMHWHDMGETSRETCELEAESVAWVVCRHFGIEEEQRSPNYLALWEADSKKIMARLDRIRSTASTIIDALETTQTNQ